MEETLIKYETEDKKTYRIYEYMKAHHSLLIACVSAMVAVASLVCCLLTYVIQCICLNTWNVPVEIIGEIGKGKYFYAIIYGTLFYLAIPVGDNWLSVYFDKILYHFDYIRLMNRLIKRLPEYQKNKEDKKFVKKRTRELKKKVNRIKRKLVIRVIILLVIFGVVLELTYVCFQISLAKITWETMMVFAVGIVFLYGLSLWKYKKLHRNVKLPELEKRVQKVGNFEKTCELMMEICDIAAEVEDSHNENKSIREYMSDEDIVLGIAMVIRSFLTLSIALVLVSFIIPKVQKEFWIYSDNAGKQYAVVYRDDKKVVLEEAEIEEKKILINTGKQLIKTYEGNVFEYRKFDEVEWGEDGT